MIYLVEVYAMLAKMAQRFVYRDTPAGLIERCPPKLYIYYNDVVKIIQKEYFSIDIF